MNILLETSHFWISIMKNSGIIAVVVVCALMVLLVRILNSKGRKIIHINKLTIPLELERKGFSQEIIINRFRNSLYDSVHNFHEKRRIDKGVFYSMPFEQVFKFNADRAIFEISDTNNFWKPILWVINIVVYKYFSNSFELSFQKVEGTMQTYSCRVYANAELKKEEEFNLKEEEKSSYSKLINKISLIIMELVCPPCYLRSIEILKSSNTETSMKEIDRLIADISNKLSLGSKDYCCNECKKKIDSRKYLRKCNRLRGFMLAPVGAKYLFLLNELQNTKGALDGDDLYYKQLEFMNEGFTSFKTSKPWWWRIYYKGSIGNKKKWLYFFEGRMRHLWFDNLIYKKLFDLQDS